MSNHLFKRGICIRIEEIGSYQTLNYQNFGIMHRIAGSLPHNRYTKPTEEDFELEFGSTGKRYFRILTTQQFNP